MVAITSTPSPNFNERKHALDMLVLHYTGMETGAAALDRLRAPDASVSAHYVVETDGRIFKLVDESKRAWHAGAGQWQDDDDINSRSIGIEIVNGGHNVPLANGKLPPYPRLQIASVMALCQDILRRHNIPPSRVVGHSDIAPDRKEDPGEHFPWGTLAAVGIGLWPGGGEPDPLGHNGNLMGKGLETGQIGASVERLQQMLKDIGYAIPITGSYNRQTELVVTAFQRHWRQEQVTGQADLGTMVRVDRLATMVVDEKK